MTPAPDSVAARLAAAAARAVVGREDALARFEALMQPALPPAVLQWWHGPGGIGKTTLLALLRARAEAAGRRTAFVDAALIDPQPAAFVAALGADDPRRADEPGVLLIDTGERIRPLWRWLREDFLPALPARWIAVVAARDAPPPEWRVDPAWQALMEVHALAPLSTGAARALLRARGVPDAAQEAALRFARGHPLALALCSEVSATAPDDDGPMPVPAGCDAVQALVTRFTRDVASPALARALRVAAFSRHVTQALLADALANEEIDDPASLFELLRMLSFVRAGPLGLSLHELVCDVLMADAQWRDPTGTQRLVRAIYAHHYDRMVAAPAGERLHHQAEALFTQRHVAHKSRFFAWDEFGQHRVEPPRGDELPRLQAMVGRHEGPAAAAGLAHWWARRRDAFRLFWHDGAGAARCDGFLLLLRLGPGASPDDLADPAVAAAWRFVSRWRPLATGDELVLLRHWMHAERHQAVSAAINLASMHMVAALISQPASAWSVVWMADPDFWRPHFDGVNFARCPAVDYESDGRRHGAFVHDWRLEPAREWIAARYRPMPFADLDAVEALAEPDAGDPTGDADAVTRLRDALRLATDPSALGRCALAHRLGLDGSALQARLREAVGALGAHPRDARLRDALWHTYIEPMHKQEQVAAELGVPLPTYRYRLQRGLARVAAALDPDAHGS